MREKYPTRSIKLRGEQQRDVAIAAIRACPLDAEHPVEVVIREEVRARGLDANALMWAGPLRDIAEQAYVGGRTYTAEVWHEHFKAEFLPEEPDERYARAGYRKWDYKPNGERILVGSTTQLTVAGFSTYLEKVMAYGAGLGVVFHASPRESF